MADYYKFGVRDAQIALWTASGTYGGLFDLIAVNSIEFRVTSVAAELQGDDDIVDTFAKTNGVTGTVKFGEGAQHNAILAVLLGVSSVSSNNKIRTYFGAEDAPYWGLAFKVVHTDASGYETHVAINKGKLTGDLSYSAAYGGYVIPQFSFKGVSDGTTLKAVTRVIQPASTALALPLTYP